jgi:hypothetical protein
VIGDRKEVGQHQGGPGEADDCRARASGKNPPFAAARPATAPNEIRPARTEAVPVSAHG